MSFNPVTGSLGAVNQVGTTATGNVQSFADKPVEQLNETTKPLRDPIIPGQFPSNEAPQNETQAEISFGSIWTTICAWFSSLAPQAFDAFESIIKWLVNWLLPPPRQAQLYEAALKRPIASTFIVCQLICCGVPMLVFLAGVFIFAVVAVLLWAVLSLLILGPILLVASLMGISLWGWGWIIYGLVKWVDQRFLGGLITRFWLPRQPQSEEVGAQDEKRD
ncbi:hypothetical protein N7495_008179 [Penicillium taxi]|uniref:uncharacterized protein n=1 Tax=Penicillium taxi TaxID=168475 RepID=UPI0025452508|nr:uncharacterized protein N7495_008179 [Penicillium taxi]KAJ5888138.1 hypothetical protein N7495_008179 [Penicillium taxi]